MSLAGDFPVVKLWPVIKGKQPILLLFSFFEADKIGKVINHEFQWPWWEFEVGTGESRFI